MLLLAALKTNLPERPADVAEVRLFDVRQADGFNQLRNPTSRARMSGGKSSVSSPFRANTADTTIASRVLTAVGVFDAGIIIFEAASEHPAHFINGEGTRARRQRVGH